MEFRKLIKFGNSSYVVSLPKKWILRNKLEKGAVIYIDEDKDGNLTFAPKEPPELEPKTAVLDITNMPVERIKRELVSYYINNFHFTRLHSKKPIEDPKSIKDALQGFIGLEVMEETQHHFLIKDFVDLRMISVEELLKKMDLIFKSILTDLKNFNIDSMMSRDEEIDKQFFLLRKIVLYNLDNPSFMKLNKKNSSDFLILRDVAFSLELLGDEVKVLSELLKSFKKEEIAPDHFELFDELLEYYINVISCFFEHDQQKSLTISDQRDKLIKKINKTFEIVKLPLGSDHQSFEAGIIKSHLIKMAILVHHIARTVYTYDVSNSG